MNEKLKNINDAVVDRLLYYLGKYNITQYELAKRCDIPHATIKSIMQRRTKGISLKTIILLAGGLNISASEFLDSKTFDKANLNLD